MMTDTELIAAARKLAFEVADRCNRSMAVVTESVMLNKLADRIEQRLKGTTSNER